MMRIVTCLHVTVASSGDFAAKAVSELGADGLNHKQLRQEAFRLAAVEGKLDEALQLAKTLEWEPWSKSAHRWTLELIAKYECEFPPRTMEYDAFVKRAMR